MARRARIFWILTILYWCALFAGTHVPARVIVKVPLNDKVEHLVGYGGLSTLLFLSFLFSGRRRPAEIAVLVLGMMMCYGAVDEWSQIPVGRDCDLFDWYADVTGSSVAVVVLTLLTRLPLLFCASAPIVIPRYAEGSRTHNDAEIPRRTSG